MVFKNERMTLSVKSIGLAAAAILGLSACGGGDAAGGDYPEPDVSLNVGVAPDFFFTHLYLAVEEGFLAEQGIDANITEFASGLEASEGVISGQADLTGTTSATFGLLADSEGDFVAIAADRRGDGWFGLVGVDGLDIQDSSDVKGLEIATEHETVLDMHVRAFLEDHGLEEEDIDYQDVNTAQLVTGLSRGDFDAASLWEPNVTTALNNIDGAHIILDSEETMPVNGFTVAGNTIHEDQELANRVLTAIDNTIQWMEENPDEVIDRVMEISGIKDEELARTVQDKITYGLSFDEEEVDAIYAGRDFYQEHGIAEATDEQLERTFDTEIFEVWKETQK